VAERALSQAPTGDAHCLDNSVRSLLKSLLDAHRQHPTWQFLPDTGTRAAARPPCPRITGLTPSHGSKDTAVTISGQHLDQVAAVTLVLDHKPDPGTYWGETQQWRCTVPMDVVNQSADALQITVPSLEPLEPVDCPSPSGPVNAWVTIEIRHEANDGNSISAIDTRKFTYDA
jgi:hypothetical protein